MRGNETRRNRRGEGKRKGIKEKRGDERKEGSKERLGDYKGSSDQKWLHVRK